MKTSLFQFLLAGSAIAIATAALLADTVTLKDGTVLEGTVIEQGDKYWVKTDKGSKFIPKTDVASINDGSAGAKGGADGSSGETGPASTNADFQAAKRRADAVETPIAGVTIWQEFIDNTTDADLLASAETEMKHWQELTDNEAEKIKGAWVGGEARKKIVDQAEGLNREAWEMLRTEQTMAAIAKLEESARIYPNSFKNNFLLGYVSLLQDQNDKAIAYFTQTLRLQPNSAAAMSNLGVAYAFKRQFDKAITYMHKAVQLEDSDEISKNLITAMQVAPPAVVRSPRLKEARSTAILMARTKGMDNSKRFFIVPMKEEIAKADEAALAGMVSSGTGFLINTEGLIITNAHVVNGGKTFMVLINNAERRSAEVLHVDEAMDLALIRVKPKEGETLPFLQFTPGDHPGDGAECTVMGYPMIDRLGAAIKITRGIVSSGNTTVSAGADVLIDAKVNPGNSGGPILDRFGQVMAVVCMKSFSTATEDSYGIGISAGNVRKFLAANQITIERGAASTTPLTTEEVATQAKGATVCIIATR